MSIVSKEQIEAKIRELLTQESFSLDDLQLDDIPFESEDAGVDFKSLFTELSMIRSELKQSNRLEKTRLETFKGYFDDEKHAKQQLIENVNALVQKTAYAEQKTLLLSIIETRDYIESFDQGLSLVFKGNNAISSLMMKMVAHEPFEYVNKNTQQILKKIDQSLEKANVIPIQTENILFDPAQMVAIETMENKSLSDQMVLETVERGYLHNNLVLRLARVKVNKISTDEHKPVEGVV